MKLIIKLLINAGVAFGLAQMLDGIHVANFTAAILFALVLGLLNVFVKPILTLISFPITVITLGLFLLVINALMILLADRLMDSVQVDGFWWALIFSLLLSTISTMVYSIFSDKK